MEIVLSASFLACVEECISERESRFEEGRVDIFFHCMFTGALRDQKGRTMTNI